MADLLFEIGCEELPAGVIDPALGWMKEFVAKNFAELRLTHGDIKALGTPRRLVLMVRDLAQAQPSRTIELLGPKVSAAYGSDGKLTPAGLGFLRSKNLDESAAYRKMTDKGELLAAKLNEVGQESASLMMTLLSTMLRDMPLPKRQRWDDSGVTFSRPVRWLLCLLGDEVVPVQFGKLTASNQTCGHRLMAPRFQGVSGIESYLSHLRHHHVVLDGDERRQMIVDGAQALASQAGGVLRQDDKLLDTVKNLVEYPWPIMGHFEPAYLEIPSEILVSEMREHQKYLAVVDSAQNLLPVFIVIAGSTPSPSLAVGNSRVLRARFEDGAFYFREDCEKSLEVFGAKLEHVMFQKELGSVADKLRRIVQGALSFQRRLESMDPSLRWGDNDVKRAAELCKFDLVTGVVSEFPELQGVMGRHYALRAGVSPDVAVAIEQHYWPKFSGDATPATDLGAIIGLADRLDTLVGVIGIGKAPKGNADPFALRRAAIGFVRIIVARDYRLSMREAVQHAISFLTPTVNMKAHLVEEQVLEFIQARVRALLLEEFPATLVDGVMGASSDDVADLWERAKAVATLEKQDPEVFAQLYATLKRAGNIVSKARTDGLWSDTTSWNKDGLEVMCEQELLREIEKAQGSSGNYVERMGKIAALKPYLDRFFDEVMVMVDDRNLRNARLGLLAEVQKLVSGIIHAK